MDVALYRADLSVGSSDNPLPTLTVVCPFFFLQTQALQAALPYSALCSDRPFLWILGVSHQYPPTFCLAYPPLQMPVLLKSP